MQSGKNVGRLCLFLVPLEESWCELVPLCVAARIHMETIRIRPQDQHTLLLQLQLCALCVRESARRQIVSNAKKKKKRAAFPV